jgi:hypothetical protein
MKHHVTKHLQLTILWQRNSAEILLVQYLIQHRIQFVNSLIRFSSFIMMCFCLMLCYRYPSFIDAVRDLDDCLSMTFLFATFPKSKRIHAQQIQLCRRLTGIWSLCYLLFSLLLFCIGKRQKCMNSKLFYMHNINLMNSIFNLSFLLKINVDYFFAACLE